MSHVPGTPESETGFHSHCTSRLHTGSFDGLELDGAEVVFPLTTTAESSPHLGPTAVAPPSPVLSDGMGTEESLSEGEQQNPTVVVEEEEGASRSINDAADSCSEEKDGNLPLEQPIGQPTAENPVIVTEDDVAIDLEPDTEAEGQIPDEESIECLRVCFQKWFKFNALLKGLKEIRDYAVEDLRQESFLRWYGLVFQVCSARASNSTGDAEPQLPTTSQPSSAGTDIRFPIKLRTRFVVIPGTKRKPAGSGEEASEEIITIGGKSKEECYEVVEYPDRSTMECRKLHAIPAAAYIGRHCSKELLVQYEGVAKGYYAGYCDAVYFLQDSALHFPPIPVSRGKTIPPGCTIADPSSTSSDPSTAINASSPQLTAPQGSKPSLGLKTIPKSTEEDKLPAWEVMDRALVSRGGEFNLFGAKKKEPQSATKYFQCYHCGKLNSLPIVAPGTLFRCGVCRELFDTTNTTKYAPKAK
jgi:hypothetical protein